MKWKTNETITEEKINQIVNNIDKDLLIARICFSLNITKEELFEQITENELNLLVASILINRGIETKSEIDKLFNNIADSILEPELLVNAKKASDIITEYCNDVSAYIYIYGDYDCDGVCSTYSFTSMLRKVVKGFLNYHLPNRSEGYGLSMDFCKKIVENHCNKDNVDKVLMITVDNGITKHEEVKYLKEHGIEVIITDHHTSKKEELPNCLIVDPHNKEVEQDDTYAHLCGCGVAFKVGQLVLRNFGIYDMMEFVPYLAIATLTDVMPLTSENLAIIQYGLEIMNSDKCPLGIEALKKHKKIDVLTANDILWTIGPMINACGRMGDTELASKLFFLDNIATPSEIVINIDKINERRKTLTKNAQKNISQMNFDNHKVCIIPTTEYPSGIIGIIAGKVAEQFNKPAIIVSPTNNGLYHGSIRSANNINMFEMVKRLNEIGLVETYGGHAEACVCSFKLSNLNAIQEYLDTTELILVKREIDSKEEGIINIDEIISFNHLNEVVYAIVNLFPCDNKKYQNPTFALTDIELVPYTKSDLTKKKWNKELKKYEFSISEFDAEFIGKPYKLSSNNPDNICFKTSEGEIWAWGFADKYINSLGCPNTINIAGEISKSFMNGKYTLNVIDIMSA